MGVNLIGHETTLSLVIAIEYEPEGSLSQSCPKLRPFGAVVRDSAYSLSCSHLDPVVSGFPRVSAGYWFGLRERFRSIIPAD